MTVFSVEHLSGGAEEVLIGSDRRSGRFRQTDTSVSLVSADQPRVHLFLHSRAGGRHVPSCRTPDVSAASRGGRWSFCFRRTAVAGRIDSGSVACHRYAPAFVGPEEVQSPLAGECFTDDQPVLRPAGFCAATSGCHVTKTIYMEVDVHPAQQVQEAEFAIRLCDDPGSHVVGAVIGGYPHESSFADHLKRFAGSKAVKGVRTVLHSADRPPGLCLTPTFVDSMKRLGDAGLSFDLCMRPDEILTGAQLASKCPQTRFVLDHCGNIGFPSPDAAIRQTWKDGLKAAAAQPNVTCKISGLIDKAKSPEWSAEQMAETDQLLSRCVH